MIDRRKTFTTANLLLFSALSFTLIQTELYSSIGDIPYITSMILLTGIAIFY